MACTTCSRYLNHLLVIVSNRTYSPKAFSTVNVLFMTTASATGPGPGVLSKQCDTVAAFSSLSSMRMLKSPNSNMMPSVHHSVSGLYSTNKSASDEQVSVTRNLINACNTMSAEELYKYDSFTKAISANIYKRRSAVGIFSSVNDLREVSGVTDARLKKLMHSINSKILKTSQATKCPISVLASSIHPQLKVTEVPDSVVSIHTQLPHVSWVKLTRDLTVDDWCTFSLVENEKKLKYDHALYQQKIWELCGQIPTASIYLMEDAPLRVNSNQIMPMLNRGYVEAAIATTLNLRHNAITAQWSTVSDHAARSPLADSIFSPNPDGTLRTLSNTVLQGQRTFKHHVYKLKPRVVSEHFSLLVGGERTSSLALLRQIQMGTCEAAKGVVAEAAAWFELLELLRPLQEQRMQALLVATAFYKLLTHASQDGQRRGTSVQ